MILAGARTDAQEDDLRRLLLRFPLLGVDAAADFDAAARVHRQCPGAGFTPRGLLDCVFGAVAWRHRASLLTGDVDLLRLAGVGIGLDQACPELRS